MDRNGAVVLLLVCFTVFGSAVKWKEKSKIPIVTEISRRLMRKCMEAGYSEPDIGQLQTVMDSVSVVKRIPDSPNTVFLSMFANVLGNVTFDTPQSELFNTMRGQGKNPGDFDYAALPEMIQKFTIVPEDQRCFVFSVLAPMAWDAVTSSENANMDPQKFELLMLAAEKIMENPPRRLDFPKTLSILNMKAFMKAMRKNHASLSKVQRAEVVEGLKEHFQQKYLNCTSSADSDKCGRWDKYVTAEAIKEFGPYMLSLKAADIGSLSEEGSCELLNHLDQFGSVVDNSRLHPSSIIKLHNKMKNCSEFQVHSDRWGRLECAADTSLCPAPAKSLSIIKVAQLSYMEVVERINDPSVKHKGKVMCALVKRALKFTGEDMCQKLSDQQLRELEPAADCIPVCILKKVPCDSEVLRSMAQKMSKPQAVALVKGQCKHLGATQLMDFFSGKVLQILPRKDLKKANITSWYRVGKVVWLPGQAMILVEKMCSEVKNCFRNLGSLTPGFTCKRIEATEDMKVQEMSKGLADVPHLLSKSQAICAARKLFSNLESQRLHYFQTISPMELNNIPTVLLIHLSPEKVRDLPDSVCKDFLDKMKMANLSTLPKLSPSRSALMDRSLKCVGSDLSSVSSEDMAQLGPLLCEVPPPQLNLMKTEVLTKLLQTMTICDSIPEKHKKDLVALLVNTFRDPGTWNETTMEEMFPLLLLDENVLSRLPDQLWMINVLHFHAPQIQGPAKDVVKKKLFRLIVSQPESESSSTVSRRKRAGDELSSSTQPTAALIQMLADANDQWTPQQLKNMTLDTFTETVEILGDVTSFSPEQLQELCTKAVEAWGDAQSMNESVVSQLGCISQCFSADDLMRMAFSQSSLKDIAQCGWTDAQISAVWKGAAGYSALSAQSLDTSDMMEMGRFICGLSSTEIQQLNSTAFQDAVASIYKVGCPAEVAQHFKPLLVDAFGEPSSWTDDEVAFLGTFVAGLSVSEFASLDTAVFNHLTPETIPLTPPSHFRDLSVEKLMALGPDNAAQVTSEQRALMSASQLDALSRTMEGRTLLEASSEAAEVMGTFTKLLLFFVLWLQLL